VFSLFYLTIPARKIIGIGIS